MYQKYFKRLFDFSFALSALIVLCPVFIVVAILVRKRLGSPVFFCQLRPGLNEKIFKMYKFRTMTGDTDENGLLLADNIRLTNFGKMLRSTSLDELPELFNILKGDMSFVGPRPLIVREMVFMTNKQRKRHSVIPGLTGLAQINGRNDIPWEKKFNLDLKYISDISFAKDILIIFHTFFKVAKQEGITADGMDTPEYLCDYLLRTGNITKKQHNVKNRKARKIVKKHKK